MERATRGNAARPVSGSDRPRPLVHARALDGVLLERYDYAPGPPADIERHVHETYQIGLALDAAGEYRYRGGTRPVPTGRLIIIHPGEPHAVRDTGPRTARARYLMMYVEPSLLAGGRGGSLPFFGEPLSVPYLVSAFIDVFRSAHTQFDLDSSVARLMSELAARAVDVRRYGGPPDLPPALTRVRDLLHDAPLADTSLAELARIAGLNPHHLVRAFTAHFGVPPHRYRRQLRIELAKRSLSRGDPLSSVALDAGFYDQSHFSRHFRRIVGTTPGRYRGMAGVSG